eukprot:scaffold1350_cov137-Skeletonema_dohrnii-CCMP3373.AAC.8
MHFATLALADLTILACLPVLEEERGMEEEKGRFFVDFAVMPSLTEMTELEAFPAFGRGSTLKMRYALEEVVVAEAAATVARRMDAMLKFMVDSDVEMCQVADKQIYELLYALVQDCCCSFILAEESSALFARARIGTNSSKLDKLALQASGFYSHSFVALQDTSLYYT